jgi:hypothetical protein
MILTQWYVRRKPCTYLASRLALSPNRPKRPSTRASSPRRTIGCVQIDFHVWHKPRIYLALTLTSSPNRLKRDLTWPITPRSSIGRIKNYFRAYGTFGVNNAPILRQEYHYVQTDQNELPLEPLHLWVPSGESKMILKHMVCLAQTMHLSCTNTNTISKRTEARFDLTHVA